MNKCDILVAGREEMQKRELAKGYFYRIANPNAEPNGYNKWIDLRAGKDDLQTATHVCMFGALRLGCGVAHLSFEVESHVKTMMAYHEACKAMSKACGAADQNFTGPWFNDAPGTTKEQVLAVFDKAIAEGGCADDSPF